MTALFVILALGAGGWFGYLLRGWVSDLERGRVEMERAVAEVRLTRLQTDATIAILAEVQQSLDDTQKRA